MGQADELRSESSQAEYAVSGLVASSLSEDLVVVTIPANKPVELYVGGGVARMCGHSVAELQEDAYHWLQFVHPADRDRAMTAWDRVLTSGEPFTEEFRIFRGDGQMRWVRASCVAERDESGNVVRVVGFVTDATEGRPAVERLASFRELLDEAPHGVSVRDTAGRIVYCNKAYARAFGYDSPDEVLGTTFERVVAPEHRADFDENILPRLLTGPWSADRTITRNDGSTAELSISATPLRGPDGKAVAIYSMVRDITEQKRAERAVRESEERYRALAENVDAAAFTLDAQFRPVALSGEVERLTGHTMGELTAGPEPWMSLVYPADWESVVSTLTGVAERGEAGTVDFRILRASGDFRWARARLRPEYGADGQIAAYHGVITDIAEIKEAELALRDAEEKQSALIADANAVIYRLGPDYRPLAMTGAVEAITGYSAQEILQNPELWPASVHPDDLPYVQQSFDEIAAKGKPHFLELRVLRRDNQIVWMRVLVTPKFDELGNLRYFDGVGFDITERMESRRREAKHTLQMSALSEISHDFATSLDFATIANRAVERIGRALGCASVLISIDPESGRLRHESAWARDPQRIAAMDEALARTQVTAAMAFGEMGLRPRIAPDLGALSPNMKHFAEVAGVGPGIMVPVEGKEGTIYAITGVRRKGEAGFDDEDLWFLTEVGSHASAALVNASLYRRQTHIAETLQRSLIPDVPKLDCLEIATCYSPASGEAEIGGDFFDLIPLDKGKVGIVVGDVSGKGIQAAVHTAETKYMLRGFANLDPDPRHVVTALNEALCVYMTESTFVTLLYAVVDVAKHSMSYVNAGHELPIILCCDDGTVGELSPGNTPLGVVPGWKFKAESAELYPDDLLFCYTDGITDVPNNGDRFGSERLLDTIRRARNPRPRELLDSVVGEVQAFGKDRQPDDQVIVVARPTE